MASLENRLDIAIDGLLAGGSTTDLDPELAGLLAPASALLTSTIPAPSQRLARGRMITAVRDRQQRPGVLAWLGLGSRQVLRLVPVTAIAILIIVILLSGSALPGQLHYPLKRGVEALRLLGIRDTATRSVFYVDLAERRLTELETLVMKRHLIAAGASVDEAAATIEHIGQAWAQAYSTPGADADQLREIALDHARRLQALMPLLPPPLQPPTQELVDEIVRLAGFSDPSPAPIATPTSTATVQPVEIPVPQRQEILPATDTSTPRPVATDTLTPTPMETATATSEVTPEPSATATNAPPATATPNAEPSLTPTFAPAPTSTPLPAPTRAPTQPAEPTPAPEVTETAVPTETPEPDETEEPEPAETETPESEETEEPEPEETETPDIDGTVTGL